MVVFPPRQASAGIGGPIRSLLPHALFGPANWALPGWLDRILPRLSVETAEPVPASLGDGVHRACSSGYRAVAYGSGFGVGGQSAP
jgi:hypothetical protein